MIYKFLCVCLLSLLCVALPVKAAGITNFSKLVTAEYWMEHNDVGDQVILDAKGVAELNKKIREASKTVFDMSAYPEKIDGTALKKKISNYEVLEDDLYLRGNKVSENYKHILRAQANTAAIPKDVKVQYAVVVRRSNLRNQPTGEGLFYFAADKDFDALQETALDPCEPVAVLHTSENKYFYYVQSLNYSGWISKYDIAFTDRGTWLQFAKPKKFLVVTGKSIKIKTWGEFVEYQQGAIIPIHNEENGNYVLTVPGRNKSGHLDKIKVLIRTNNTSVHEGYLPYTANNIIDAAFKFYGMPYGWGGLKSSVDCSSLLFNAYRTVGIYLPRNADEQEQTAGVTYNLANMDGDKALATIKGLTPGACLYMDGHAMMYLGKSNDIPFILHALGSYYNNDKSVRAMRVVVSDLSLLRGNGYDFLANMRTAKEFK